MREVSNLNLYADSQKQYHNPNSHLICLPPYNKVSDPSLGRNTL